MAPVVDLKQYRDDHTPHLSGMARCIACHHEWPAVCPTGTFAFFECPQCGLFKGKLKYDVIREGKHWTCNCGNDIFYISEDGTYCPVCGAWQTGF